MINLSFDTILENYIDKYKISNIKYTFPKNMYIGSVIRIYSFKSMSIGILDFKGILYIQFVPRTTLVSYTFKWNDSIEDLMEIINMYYYFRYNSNRISSHEQFNNERCVTKDIMEIIVKGNEYFGIKYGLK